MRERMRDFSYDWAGLANAIKQARKGRGLSQQGLGKVIARSKSTISRLESCKQFSDIGTMLAVCWLLDINPLDHLYVGEEIKKTAAIWDDAAIAAGAVAEGLYEVADDGTVMLGGSVR